MQNNRFFKLTYTHQIINYQVRHTGLPLQQTSRWLVSTISSFETPEGVSYRAHITITDHFFQSPVTSSLLCAKRCALVGARCIVPLLSFSCPFVCNPSCSRLPLRPTEVPLFGKGIGYRYFGFRTFHLPLATFHFFAPLREQ